MPGINLEFLKRPHDLALRLQVQDLCLVDRVQTFGPEYELVVCSSGRSLLGFSPPSSTPSSMPPSCSSSALLTNQTPSAKNTSQSTSSLKPNSSFTTISTDVFDIFGGVNSGSLLTLGYSFIQPHSPRHPAMVGAGQEEGAGLDAENDAVIHRVNIQCTAVDAIGMYVCMFVVKYGGADLQAFKYRTHLMLGRCNSTA